MVSNRIITEVPGVKPLLRAYRVPFMFLCCLLIGSVAYAKPKKPGKLIVPSLLGQRDTASQPGFVPPLLWLYDEVGTALPSTKGRGAYDVGEYIELAEGWYLVELGNVHTERNRVKVFVKSKKVTVVPTGLVVVSAEAYADQPRDTCSRWNGQLFVHLPLDPGPGPVVATNRTKKPHRVGIVQVIAGYYRIQWNRFSIKADVKSGMAFELPTGMLGPMPQKGYQLHAKKGHAKDNPGLRLCAKRPTRVLARSFWGTYNRPISQYPFKQREWEQITVALPESKKGPYRKMKQQAIKGSVYRGPGSEPTYVWDQPELAPPPQPEPEKTAP